MAKKQKEELNAEDIKSIEKGLKDTKADRIYSSKEVAEILGFRTIRQP